jgi:hypothetical protein
MAVSDNVVSSLNPSYAQPPTFAFARESLLQHSTLPVNTSTVAYHAASEPSVRSYSDPIPELSTLQGMNVATDLEFTSDQLEWMMGFNKEMEAFAEKIKSSRHSN